MKYYSDDICGDNAFPRNVKQFVNQAVKRLQGLEEDTEIIGENFALHFTKYAKRPVINELPRTYGKKMGPGIKRSKAGRKKKVVEDNLPETVEEWLINMPSMLDSRVSISLMDVVNGDNKFEEDFEWVDAEDVETDPTEEGKNEEYKCHLCDETFATKVDMEQHAIVHRQPGPRSRSRSPRKEIKEELLAPAAPWWEVPGAMVDVTPIKEPSAAEPPAERPSPRSRKLRLSSSPEKARGPLSLH